MDETTQSFAESADSEAPDIAAREASLAEREAAVAAREMKASAAERLSERGLPSGLIACMNFSSQESFEESFNSVCSCFSEAVRAGIGERVHNGAPGKARSCASDAFLEGLGIIN